MDVSRSCNLNTPCRRNQRKPEGKTRQGEGHCRNDLPHHKKRKKEELLFFESTEHCQNRSRSNSCFVNSHCSAQRLSVETSVRAARVNSRVTYTHAQCYTCMWLRGSDSLCFLHCTPHTSLSLSDGCLLYRVCQHRRENLEFFHFVIG